MKRFAWLTDIHLNFLAPAAVRAFLDKVEAATADGVLVGGDIAEAHDLAGFLHQIAERLTAEIYFVLGNHDYYYGSIDGVRAQVDELCRAYPKLHYLTSGDVFELTPSTGLVGHDGWADARLGDYERSLVSMNDFRLIDDLQGLSKAVRQQVLHELGDRAAHHVARWLPEALARYAHVVLLTHVPPFAEACWHEGRLSDAEWMPHFTCKAVGDVLREIMPRWPERQLTVLCGHTHGCGEARPLPNVLVLTGGAEYGAPRIERVFEWD